MFSFNFLNMDLSWFIMRSANSCLNWGKNTAIWRIFWLVFSRFILVEIYGLNLVLIDTIRVESRKGCRIRERVAVLDAGILAENFLIDRFSVRRDSLRFIWHRTIGHALPVGGGPSRWDWIHILLLLFTFSWLFKRLDSFFKALLTSSYSWRLACDYWFFDHYFFKHEWKFSDWLLSILISKLITILLVLFF